MKGPPKVIGIIPLSANSDSRSTLAECLSEASWHSDPSNPVIHASYLKFKSKCSFIVSNFDMMSILEVAKVSDLVLFVVKAEKTIESMIDPVSK